jgi:hypothetical protein
VSGSLYITYTDADFRAQFPYFANTTLYPEVVLQMYFTMGTAYVQNLNIGCLTTAQRQLALYLMTAHLQAMFTAIVADNGSAPGVVTEAQIDKIRVSIQPPPDPNEWTYWLNQTPWGQQLLALLSAASVGGFYVAGRPELRAFRRAYGRFG